MQDQFPENIDQIEDFYRSKLGEVREPVSDDLWSKIEKELDKASPAGGDGKPHSFYRSPYFFAGIGVACLLAFLYIFTKTNEQPRVKIDKQEQPKREIIAPRGNTVTKVVPMDKSDHEKLLPHAPVKQNVNKEKRQREAENLPIKADTVVAPKEVENDPMFRQEVEKEETPTSEIEEKQSDVKEEKAAAPKSFYDKLKMQQKDSVRDLFSRKKKK